MRIIAGTLKGRRLSAPTWDGLRPTSDKLRETLFNIIAGQMDGAQVLDGYAGTGAVGLEALSRGARHVTFVERDARAVRLIAENVKRCGVTSGYSIVRADAWAFTDGAGRDKRTARVEAIEGTQADAGGFDLIFLDPPYEDADVHRVWPSLAQRLTPDGLLVLEHATRRPPETRDDIPAWRTVKAGDSSLTFYRRPATPESTAPPMTAP